MTTLLTSDPSTIVTVFGVTAVLLLLANILQAVVALTNKNRVQEAEDGRMYALAALKESEEKAQRIAYDRDQCGALRDRIERAAKVVEKDRDVARAEAMQFAADVNTLHAERANLYFRNSKGQIEPITPKPRKPHTLKHVMTVKHPTQEQAKRIFREAKKAGILHRNAELPSGRCPSIWFLNNDGVHHCGGGESGCKIVTASEFVRRIKGEID
jgi:hypothetical protein